MTSTPEDYRSKSAAEVIDALASLRFEPPLAELCQELRSVPEVLRFPILISDFDMEVQMNGILGFLENSAGRYLTDTIEALDAISARETAATLRTIQRLMVDHGMTFERLRAGSATLRPYDITTFSDRHGTELSHAADLIDGEAGKLYIYHADGEPVFDLLEAYLERRRDEVVAALDAIFRRAPQ